MGGRKHPFGKSVKNKPRNSFNWNSRGNDDYPRTDDILACSRCMPAELRGGIRRPKPGVSYKPAKINSSHTESQVTVRPVGPRPDLKKSWEFGSDKEINIRVECGDCVYEAGLKHVRLNKGKYPIGFGYRTGGGVARYGGEIPVSLTKSNGSGQYPGMTEDIEHVFKDMFREISDYSRANGKKCFEVLDGFGVSLPF